MACASAAVAEKKMPGGHDVAREHLCKGALYVRFDSSVPIPCAPVPQDHVLPWAVARSAKQPRVEAKACELPP
eukprot:191881-Alexandrium_andersonii.AAC.1